MKTSHLFTSIKELLCRLLKKIEEETILTLMIKMINQRVSKQKIFHLFL